VFAAALEVASSSGAGALVVAAGVVVASEDSEVDACGGVVVGLGAVALPARAVVVVGAVVGVGAIVGCGGMVAGSSAGAAMTSVVVASAVSA